ncbi:lipopolysaccharide biosynthesis protein [Christiangramia sp. SM2212]|uniref:Lipopolysaccharide biosynthesis protein n=1 Tax=Christiangramia sediminicola TaxID=3073267 RepID=A0ABU1ELR8_9FLAO|nr:lipopolysaccharide biosynthesis protein [Christiangramia sp. SM2212]MDR5589335.1 lipopolysaccharide biosynthesis protein [Christiangramia sp. SM2212]
MSSNLKKDLIFGIFWSSGGQLSIVLISLLTNIILARMLSPSEFGKVGVILFFIVIANVFTRGGLAGALVRMKTVNTKDYSTVFIFNLVISVICYLLLIAFSSEISIFYNDPGLADLLIFIGTVLILNSLYLVNTAKLMRELRFKEKTIYELCAVIISSIFGIYMASNGFGVWSLVYMQISNSLTMLLLLKIFASVKINFIFSKRSFRKLFSFGANTTLASIINTTFENIYHLILGKYFSISQVGYYYQANKIQSVPNGILNTISQSVVFSSLSKVQNDLPVFVNLYQKIIVLFTIGTALIASLIYLFSEEIIQILFTAEWLRSVFYLKILILASFFYMQEQFNRVVFKVFDKTKKILGLELVKKGIQSITILVGVVTKNLDILLYGYVFTSIISYFINLNASRKIIKINNLREEINTVGKILICSVLSGGFYIAIKLGFNLSGVKNLLFIPIVVLIYFFLLKKIQVFDCWKECRKVYQLIIN